jgi:RNA polymerase sigma factor for flagellar operon FliA
LQGFERRLRGQLGRDPSDFEVSAAMGITSVELDGIRTACAPLKFEPVDNTYSETDAAFWDQSPSAIENLISAEDRKCLAAAIADLPERLQLVIQLYFVEELNLAEIASVLGLSVPRIYQLKDQALRKVRERLGEGAAPAS